MAICLTLIILNIKQKNAKMIIVSVVTFFLCILLIAIPGIEREIAAEKALVIRQKLDSIYAHLCNYQKVHDGLLPQPEMWCDELMQSNPTINKNDFEHTIYGRKVYFVYNKDLPNMHYSLMDPKTVLLFTTYESDQDWNWTGNGDLFRTLAENDKSFNLYYVLLKEGYCVGCPGGRPNLEGNRPLVWKLSVSTDSPTD